MLKTAAATVFVATVLSMPAFGQDPNDPPNATVVAEYDVVRTSRTGQVMKVTDGNVTCYWINERHRDAVQPTCVVTTVSVSVSDPLAGLGQ